MRKKLILEIIFIFSLFYEVLFVKNLIFLYFAFWLIISVTMNFAHYRGRGKV